MSSQPMRVFVMENDPQVLKGLALLLEGMCLTVVTAVGIDDLKRLNIPNTERPALLLLPLEGAHGISGIELVKQIRSGYEYPIPAILLRYEHALRPDRFIDTNIFVLSNCLAPNELRRVITNILGNEMTAGYDVES